ncbi:MAG: alpha/beta hydrolase [Firmicutes bacterium]|nr:alpha/beta hydrolase [Bacillota bacterium]
MSMTQKSFETKLGTIRYWIEDAGHNSNTDKPDIINGLIESFLENEVRIMVSIS